MINILGEHDGETKLTGLDRALSEADIDMKVGIHIYGKSPTKIDRKMGHINVVGDELDAIADFAKKVRKTIDI